MPDSLVTVVGSVTRAYTLSVLAGTRLPQTAYRVAKLANLSPPNVYVELRKLERSGIVIKREGGWTLVDARVRAFFEGQGPLFERTVSLERKQEWSRKNRRRIDRALGEPIPRVEVGSAREPPVLREFSRSPTKNKLLRAAGLRESAHRAR